MSTDTHIAIAGITGQLGTLIARAVLAADPDVQITGLCRDKGKISSDLSSSPRVKIHQGSATDPDTLRTFVRGSQVVVCCYLGDNELMVDTQKLLIDAAVAEGVPRYIASDYSNDYTQLEKGQLPAKDPMIEVKAYLDGIEQIEGVHVLIGVFTEVFVKYLGFWDAEKRELKYWGSGDEIWEFTTYGTCAEYVARVALDETAVGEMRFLGDRQTIKQLARTIERATGQDVTMVNLGSIDELQTQMEEARKRPVIGWDVMPLFYVYYTITGAWYVGEKLDSARYKEVKPVTTEEFFQGYSH